MENFSKELADKDFENNIFENEPWIQPAVSINYFETLFSKCPTVFELFMNIVIQKLLCM